MAGTGPTDLHDLALELLGASSDALDTIPTYDATLFGAPDRKIIGPGIVALDCCDQLAVHVNPIVEGTSAKSVGNTNYVQLVVTISRCVPSPDDNMNPPPAAEQTEAARQINADKWALWNYLHQMISEGELFERCCDVTWGPLSPLTPSGGCGGSTLLITVCFDGYETVLGT